MHKLRRTKALGVWVRAEGKDKSQEAGRVLDVRTQSVMSREKPIRLNCFISYKVGHVAGAIKGAINNHSHSSGQAV